MPHPWFTKIWVWTQNSPSHSNAGGEGLLGRKAVLGGHYGQTRREYADFGVSVGLLE